MQIILFSLRIYYVNNNTVNYLLILCYYFATKQS